MTNQQLTTKPYRDSMRLTTPASPIKLQEGESAPSEIQVIRNGMYFHPVYGEFTISGEVLQNFIRNFEANVLRRDIPFDYNHDWGKAAGWVESLSIKNGDSLFAKVKWTKSGKESIESGEYRYTSLEFDSNYEDNESQQKFGPTVLAVALTNRPFIKGMKPATELNEASMGELEMDKTLIEENKKLLSELTALRTDKDKLEGSVKSLSEENAGLKKELSALHLEKQQIERTNQFDDMLRDGKVCEAQRESWMKNDLVKFAELASATKPNLKAVGSSENAEPGEGGDAADKLLALAEARAAKTGEDFGTAMKAVGLENLELAKQVK